MGSSLCATMRRQGGACALVFALVVFTQQVGNCQHVEFALCAAARSNAQVEPHLHTRPRRPGVFL